MLFNTIEFTIFIFITLPLYYLLPQKIKNIFLLLVSYIFYYFSGISSLLVLFIYTLLAYIAGIYISKNRPKKIVLTICVLFYFLMLNYFKYLGLFSEILNLNLSINNIVIPAGISFYTFQIVAYLIDVYRGNIEPEKNYVSFFLYISFFPKLLVGPIENSKRFLKQINEDKVVNWNSFYRGILFVLWGFFIKLCLADRIGMYVDTVYGDYTTYQGFYVLIAVILYSFQIYCDFLGYTYIARGLAIMMGFELMDNFNAPYFGLSVNDFWKRWHISLTSWFRDYLYIPLGGNRKGTSRKYINKLLVFLASGLWHGSSISFVLWGLINGVYVIVEEIMAPIQNTIESKLKTNKDSKLFNFIKNVRMFILITFAWIFFRSNTLSEAINIVKSIFACNNIQILFNGAILDKDLGLGAKNTLLLIPLITVLLVVDYCKRKNISIVDRILNMNFILRSIIIASLCLFVLLFGKYGLSIDMASFIYARF